GATDAPAVDVKARDVATLVDGAAYGDMTDYLAVPPQMYLLDVYAAGTETLVETFDANLSGLAGGAAAVFASGFLSPDDDQDGPAFGIFAALPDGQVVEFPPFDLGEKAPNSLVFVTGSETYKKGKFTRGWENAVDGDMTGFDGTTWARGDGDQMGPAWAIFRYADFGLYKFNYLAFLTDNGPEDNANAYDYQTLILDVWVSTTGMADEDFTQVIKIKRKGDGKFLEWRQLGEYITAKYVKLRLLSPSYYPAGWRQIVEFQTQTEKKMGAMPAADQDQIAALPKGTELVGNYPNPFNPETVIRYTLDRDAQVSLQIFDTLGRVVATLVDGRQNAGTYNITWRPANLPSGLYFYRMTADEANFVKRMMFVK
ncbi:T9SS type A sorting domain-containing protein, partial [candidate division KSB1 bacterium]|nr:T9SS type A sorting domain-containing protein [candidate division KSB1 bacterium]